MTEQGSEAALRALELGAIDLVTKPRLGMRDGLFSYTDLIAGKIRITAAVRLVPLRRVALCGNVSVVATVLLLRSPLLSTEKLIIIGASTVGTEAIQKMYQPLPPNYPGIMIAQHMPAGFARLFAEQLNGSCRIKVSEAVQGERILSGHAYIALGGFLLSLVRSGVNYVVQVDLTPSVNRHRPSVDVLFDSAVRYAGKSAIGIFFFGMGRDGAEGPLRMRQAGSNTLAQDVVSCVVFGMPREAIDLGAAHEVVPLRDMSQRVMVHLRSFGQLAKRV